MDSPTDIFISYRRADGRDVARTVQLALRNAGKYNVFFDYSSLRDGVFNDKIYTAIDQCRVFVLVLSPDSLTRCAADGDWVAIEINRARKAGCTIIPLAVDSNYDKWPADLPENLHFLKTIQQTKLLTDEYFDESISRLLQRIAAAPPKKTTAAAENNASATAADDRLMEALLIHIEGCRHAVGSDGAGAIRLLEKSAAMGFGDSLSMLGMIYERGKFGITADLGKALELYGAAASKDSPGGWLGLAGLYRQGIGATGSAEYLDEQSANCKDIARELRDARELKIDLSAMNPNSRMEVSPEFRWVIVDGQQQVIDRGTGNSLSKTLRKLSGLHGRFFIYGFDGDSYRQGPFIK